MEYCCSLFAVIFLRSIWTVLGQNASVSIGPSAFTAGLSSEEITFTCTVSRPVLAVNMFVDEEQFSSDLEDRGIRLDAAAILTIEPRIENNNTKIKCLATFESGSPVFSPPLIFLVQGLLSAPPDLEIITIDSRPNFNRLSWQPPFTLDISDVEQDITGYKVCFSLSATEMCVLTEETSYDFLNIRLPLEFLVTAINVVGESNASRVLHQACEGSVNSGLVTVSVSQTFGIVVNLQQPPGITCYDVYGVRLTATTDIGMSPILIGPLFPVLVNTTVQILNLGSSNSLQENQVYEAEVTAINIDGERVLKRTLFSTYDVQAVIISQQDQSLRIQCSFVENSSAKGCQVTVCLRDVGQEVVLGTCRNQTFNRTSTNDVIDVSEVGIYVITSVADIEEDGSINVVGNIAVFGALEAPPAVMSTVASIATVNTPETAGNTSTGDMKTVGIVVGVLAAVLLAVLVVVLAVTATIWRAKRRKDDLKSNGEQNKMKRNENGPNGLSESITKLIDESVPGPEVVGATKPESLASYRPTSPLYTDVMHTPTSPLMNQEGTPPDLPPKMERSSQRYSDIISSDPEPTALLFTSPEFREPLQNTSREEIHYSPHHRKLIEQHQLGNAQMSQESLASQNSQASGNITYAELEHHIKSRRTQQRDKTSVLYSEIKVYEIPPVLPEKKGRAGSSCVSVDMDSPQHSSDSI